MEELMKSVRALADTELNRANKVKPLFADEHHGWAVMLEELLEAKDDIKALELKMGNLFVNIMKNQGTTGDALSIRISALELACEAIQIAAMGKKYVDSLEAKHEGD